MPLTNAERKKRYREYRERHPDRIAAYKERTKGQRSVANKAYREAHKDKITEQIRLWKQAHPNYDADYQKRYRELHRDEARLKAKQRYAAAIHIKTISEDERFFNTIPPDEGCKLYSACLTCPFTDCEFDED